MMTTQSKATGRRNGNAPPSTKATKARQSINTERAFLDTASSMPPGHPGTTEVGRLAIRITHCTDDRFEDTAGLHFYAGNGDEMGFAGVVCEVGLNVGDMEVSEVSRTIEVPFAIVEISYGEGIGTVVYERRELTKTTNLGCVDCAMVGKN